MLVAKYQAHALDLFENQFLDQNLLNILSNLLRKKIILRTLKPACLKFQYKFLYII